jgi:hypothetical protein
MSCEDCDMAQEIKEGPYYFRIGVGNIEVYCCEDHARELQKIIRGETR